MWEIVQALISALACLGTSDDNKLCELWHKRMAHLHHPALRLLRHMVTGLPEFSSKQSDVCRGCALGKYTKTAFPRSDNRSAGILDLIHSDLCGLMSSISLR